MFALFCLIRFVCGVQIILMSKFSRNLAFSSVLVSKFYDIIGKIYSKVHIER
jgi:hypothetical protein